MVKEIVKGLAAPSATKQEEDLLQTINMPAEVGAKVTIEHAGTSLTIPIPYEKVAKILEAVGITNRIIVSAKGWKLGFDLVKKEEASNGRV